MENKPVQCPHCKSENVTFALKRYKATICRFLKYLCLIIMIVSFATNLNNFIDLAYGTNKETGTPWPIAFFVLCSFLTVIFQLLQGFFERKIDTYAICKDCATTWIANIDV